MRHSKLLLSLVLSLGVFGVARAQTAERIYGGLYQPAPSEPQPMRVWRLSERGGLPPDFPEAIAGRFIALHGASLVDDCKLVLIQTEDGRRRALRFGMLGADERRDALAAHERATAARVSATEAGGRRPYAAVWQEYSKETDAPRVGTFETEHFLFFFGRDGGKESRLLQDEGAVGRMKERAEDVWRFYQEAMHVEMPFARAAEPRKIPVFLLETGLAKHPSGEASARKGAILLHPSEVADNTNRFAHEFAHVIQHHNGGSEGPRGQGQLYEAHADWLSYQHNSSRGSKAILSSTRYSDYPLFSWQVGYGYWPLLQYLSETYGPALCVDLWNHAPPNSAVGQETPLETLHRLGVERGHWSADESWGGFADALARAAAHKAYWDFIPQMSYLYVLQQGLQAAGGGDLRRFTRNPPSRLGDSWMPAPERAPAQFGYHTIELKPSGARITAAVEKTADCDWRLIGVARDANWKCRYSEVVASGQTMTLAVDPADQAWALIVLAVPPRYRAHTFQDEKANAFARHAFKLKLDGAEPEGGKKSAPAVVFLERGAKTEWRYRDTGEEPAASWTSGNFDDSNWPQGRAPLGYGQAGVTTEISYGGDPRAKHLAAYFRRSFDFAAGPAPLTQLAVSMCIDDGVVVYLNGRELVRQNMPAGPITATTRAVRRIEGNEETVYRRHVVPAAALVPGRNVLAAEVHQINGGSSDLFFDLQLSTVVDVSAARLNAAARDVTLAFHRKHYIPAGTRIPDGYIDGGRGMTIADDGTAQSGREVMVVDRARDPELRRHLEYARSPAVTGLPLLERATTLARYVDALYSPAGGRRLSEEVCSLMLEPYRGMELLIGAAIHAGVCRHRGLAFKLLADEAGLPVALVRGNYGAVQSPGGHVWNELILPDGAKLIVDVMNPRPDFVFPKATDAAAGRYLTVKNAPYYPPGK